MWVLVPLAMLAPHIELPSIFSAAAVSVNMQQYMFVSSMGTNSLSWEILLTNIWVTVSTLLFGYWLASHLYFSRSIKLSPVFAGDLPLLLPRTLNVYTCVTTYSPMLIGIIKPKLIIPENFFEIYNKDQQKLILEHEICHFNRNDIYWNLIAMCTVAIFWFHPLAWLAYARFRRDQELSCDHIVLARKHEVCRINYSKALLVAADKAPAMAFAQLSFKKYGDKNVMFERINQIKTNTKTSSMALTLITTASIVLLSSFSYAGNGVHKEGVEQPSKDHIYPVMRVEPKYPLQAAKDKVEGSVVLKFDVLANGSVSNVSVIKATPEKVFDKQAKIALRQWTYNKSSNGSKNNLVQLDFAMDKHSDHEFRELTEQIKVTND